MSAPSFSFSFSAFLVFFSCALLRVGDAVQGGGFILFLSFSLFLTLSVDIYDLCYPCFDLTSIRESNE